LTTEATWEIWVNNDNTVAAEEVWFSKQDGDSDRSWSIGKSGSTADAFTAVWGRDVGVFAKADTWDGLPNGLTQIVVVFDNAVRKAYANGVDLGAATVVGSGTVPTSLFNSSQPFLIGAISTSPYSLFSTQPIGSPKIYSKAFTADEVLQNYNAQKRKYGL
jgi:hypothetical protein